jgi:predicted SAM-dependent methyltransferase
MVGVKTKLDIGGGKKRSDDWKTIDINPEADIVHNLDALPWPIDSDSCTEIYSAHTLEHLNDPMRFMEEAFRIAKDGAILKIKIPWWKLDMFAAPEHKHWFRPEWFRRLCRDSWSKGMKHMCKINWHIVKERKIRGKHNKLKVYEYEVWLKSNKSK